jgi:nucleoside-diphosphate-sugar epimerase
MEILLLGGTAFLGRAVAQSAMKRGHDLTCAARGTRPAPEGTSFVRLDRDEDDGLEPVSGRRWDAVIDVARQPGQARRAVRDLDTKHWVFISSANVYARFDTFEHGEDSPLNEPLEGDVMEDMSTYGAAKVACENAFRDSGVTATIVRAGLIGGPGDVSGRSGYYPWRFAHPTGPDVLVPADSNFHVSLIDVDDLADWIVHTAEQRLDGAFNAAGPTTTLGEYLDVAREVAGSSADLFPVSADAFEREGISVWMGPKSLPLWIDDYDWRYFGTHDTSAARAAGLRTRPLKDTLSRALFYENERTAPRNAGLTDAEEIELRKALSVP